MPNNKNKKKNEQMREEYGAGYDLSPDDFDVVGQNDAAKKNKTKSKMDKQTDDDYPINPS